MFGPPNHFGQPSSSQFGSQSVSVSNTFGGTKTFLGREISTFGGNSTGVFGATQSSPFPSNASSSSTPAFGISGSVFGVASTPFGSSSSAFGGSSSVGQKAAFGGFGSTQNSPFDNKNQPQQPAFWSSRFGTSTALAPSSHPAFGRGSGTPAFGTSSTPGFSNTPAFGVSSNPTLSSSSPPAFGQSISAFGSSFNMGVESPPSAFQTGFQAPPKTSRVSGFQHSTLGNQSGGSRVTPYKPKFVKDMVNGKELFLWIQSIAAMPEYRKKSHEELRFEDYQLAGGSKPPIQPATAVNLGTLSATASSTSVQSSPFATITTLNSFPEKSPWSTGFGPSSSNSHNGSLASLATNSLFGPTSAPERNVNSSPSFSLTSASLLTPTSSSGYTPQSCPLFSSTVPSLEQTVSPIGQTPASIGSGGSIFSSSQSLFQASIPEKFSPSQPSLSNPLQSIQPAQTLCTFNNCSQTKYGDTSASPNTQNIGLSSLGNSFTSQSSIMQPIPVTNPFGALPVAPQMSIGQNGKGSSIRYGISSLPVANEPAPVRASSLLTCWKLSQRPLRLPVRRYNPSADRPKVPFFGEGEVSTPKADAYIIPRENPRSLVICPVQQWPSRMHGETQSPSKDVSRLVQENELPTEDCLHRAINIKESKKTNDVPDDYPVQDGGLFNSLKANRFHATAISYEPGDDIEALMPKLRLCDYYTEPTIQELAGKERAEPGYCSHVNDFVIGQHGYGSIKFMGKTDVRQLDLESIVQFNNREVIVYFDESKKPPVGQGLNKPAVVTLLNIKCVSKKTGQQYTEGPNTEKYKEMLKKKTEDQGAEFVSYDPLKGEWKFRVDHF